MQQNIKKRLLRTLILALIGLSIGVGIGFYQVYSDPALSQKKPAQSSASLPVSGLDIGGDFTLINQEGKTVTRDSWPGKYQLIYFGFTYCPAICPTELQKMTRALGMLPEEVATKIQPILITIDPERDDVATIREYVKLFHPRLIGLTGSREQIDPVIADFRIFARKVEDPDLSDYTMDHSTFTYLFDPDGTLVSIFRIDDSAAFMAEDMGDKVR